MWPLRNAASTGLVLKPETNALHGPDPFALPAISRWCARRMCASSCPLPPSAHPSESYRNNFAALIASGLSCSYVSEHAHSARSCDRYRLASDALGCVEAMSGGLRGGRGGGCGVYHGGRGMGERAKWQIAKLPNKDGPVKV